MAQVWVEGSDPSGAYRISFSPNLNPSRSHRLRPLVMTNFNGLKQTAEGLVDQRMLNAD